MAEKYDFEEIVNLLHNGHIRSVKGKHIKKLALDYVVHSFCA